MKEPDLYLDQALDSLREEFRQLAPPPHIEAALQQHLRSRCAHRRTRQSTLILSAAAAIFLLALFLVPKKAPTAHPNPNSVLAKATAMPSHESPAAAPAHAFHRTRPAAHRPARPAQPYAVRFTALPYAPPLDDSQPLNLYQVRLPLSVVAGFGIPVGPAPLDATVSAELIAGNDGVARAIRFVPDPPNN